MSISFNTESFQMRDVYSTKALQTLRVVVINKLAGASTHTHRGPLVPRPTTLSPLINRCSSRRSCRRRCRRSSRRGRSSSRGRGWRSRTSSPRVEHSVVDVRLLVQILVPRESVTVAGEHIRNPRVLVCEVPDGDSDTPGDGLAAGHCVGVVFGLLRYGGRCGGRCGSDIEFSESNIDVEGGESIHVGSPGGDRRGLTDDQMGLHANTVDLST
jgi:hypothetical protein